MESSRRGDRQKLYELFDDPDFTLDSVAQNLERTLIRSALVGCDRRRRAFKLEDTGSSSMPPS